MITEIKSLFTYKAVGINILDAFTIGVGGLIAKELGRPITEYTFIELVVLMCVLAYLMGRVLKLFVDIWSKIHETKRKDKGFDS